jgi:dUTP pyrophosphatase
MFNVKVKVEDQRLWPDRAHSTDAGADLRTKNDLDLKPGLQYLFDTGVAIKIPAGFVGMVFNRSSQGKIGVQIANGTGIIDSDYRGNIRVLLRNTGTETYSVKAFDTRIAQLVIVPIVLPNFVEEMDGHSWDDTVRGVGGFGSTGV